MQNTYKDFRIFTMKKKEREKYWSNPEVLISWLQLLIEFMKHQVSFEWRTWKNYKQNQNLKTGVKSIHLSYQLQGPIMMLLKISEEKMIYKKSKKKINSCLKGYWR